MLHRASSHHVACRSCPPPRLAGATSVHTRWQHRTTVRRESPAQGACQSCKWPRSSDKARLIRGLESGRGMRPDPVFGACWPPGMVMAPAPARARPDRGRPRWTGRTGGPGGRRIHGNARRAQQCQCLECPCRQPGRDRAADGEELITACGELAAGDGGAADAAGTAIARGRGHNAGAAADVDGVPARSPPTVPCPRPGPPALPWPDTSSPVTAAATISSRAAAAAARTARAPVSSRPELMASRSRARPAGRA